MFDQSAALAAHAAARIPTGRVHRLVDDEPECEQPEACALAAVPVQPPRRAPVQRAAHLPPTITDRIVAILTASPVPMTAPQIAAALPADLFGPGPTRAAKRVLALLVAAERLDARVVRAGVLQEGRGRAVLWTVPR